MNACRASPNAAAQNPSRNTDAANTAMTGARIIPTTAIIEIAARNHHGEPLTDARDRPPRGKIAAELADDQGSGDQGSGCDVSSHVRRDHRDQGDDCALAQREENRRQVHHRPELLQDR